MKASALIVPFKIDPHSNLSVFMIHDLLGSVAIYKSLAKNIHGYSIFGVQPESLREEEVDNLQARSKRYAQEILVVQQTGFYNLMGYSLGGILALEVACQLKKMDKKIGFVVIIDSPPLAALQTQPIPQYVALLDRLKKNIFKSQEPSCPDTIQNQLDKTVLAEQFFIQCELLLQSEKEDQKKAMLILLQKIKENMYMELHSHSSAYMDFNLTHKLIIFSTLSTSKDFSVDIDLGWEEVFNKELDMKKQVITLPENCHHFNIFKDQAALRAITETLHEKILKLNDKNQKITYIESFQKALKSMEEVLNTLPTLPQPYQAILIEDSFKQIQKRICQSSEKYGAYSFWAEAKSHKRHTSPDSALGNNSI